MKLNFNEFEKELLLNAIKRQIQFNDKKGIYLLAEKYRRLLIKTNFAIDKALERKIKKKTYCRSIFEKFKYKYHLFIFEG